MVLLPTGAPSFLTKTEGVPPKGTLGAEGLNLRVQITPSSMGGHVGGTLWDWVASRLPPVPDVVELNILSLKSLTGHFSPAWARSVCEFRLPG